MATATTKMMRPERVAGRALGRSALYQLLSQALTYPSRESLEALTEADLPQALEAAADAPALGRLLAELKQQLKRSDLGELQAEHRRIFTHILSLDCPPCETLYTARDVFQETAELADISGFYRAFGLEMAEKERLDHISVELEFMHVLAYKEAYAYLHHGAEKARLCRGVERDFMQDHLGRWAGQFAKRLRERAGPGYFGCVAELLEAFVSDETDFLRTRPDAAFVNPDWRATGPEDNACGATEDCPVVQSGGNDGNA